LHWSRLGVLVQWGQEDLILKGSQHRTMSGRATLENVRAWDET